MNYLFFDTESANQYGLAKICSFGYVLTNEKLEVIESDDILIDPEAPFDRYVLERVIANKPEDFENKGAFPEHYDRIYKLLMENIVIGHSIYDDIKVLRGACKRYQLKMPNFNVFDTQIMYSGYVDELNYLSLDNVAEKLGVERQDDKHTSLQDARITMEIAKKLSELTNKPLAQILHMKCNKFSKRRLKDENKLHGRNHVIFTYAIKTLKPMEGYPQNLAGKSYCMSCNYEKVHFKEMLLILQEVINRGGKLTTRLPEATTYIKYDLKKPDGTYRACRRETFINESGEYSNIEIIELEDFMKLIGFDESKVEDNLAKITKDFNEFDKDYKINMVN